jgi:hypothetical protein
MVARTVAHPRSRRRRSRLRLLAVVLVVVVAILAYARITRSDESWRALRGPIPFGDGSCAVALSPDHTVERTVCFVSGTTSCFDRRRRLAASRADCEAAREALVDEGLLPAGQAGS